MREVGKQPSQRSPQKRAIRLTVSDRERLRAVRARFPAPLKLYSRRSLWVSLLLYAVLASACIWFPGPPVRVEVVRYTVTVRPTMPVAAEKEETVRRFEPEPAPRKTAAEAPAERLAPPLPPDLLSAAVATFTPIPVPALSVAADPAPPLPQLEPVAELPRVPSPLPLPVAVDMPTAQAVDIRGVESNFWSEVHAATAAALQYPVLARRRGMEGQAVVELAIGRDGVVVALTEKDASAEIFMRAVRDAVDRAQPYPPPPPELPSPVVLELPVAFRLVDDAARR